jgi:hypothetical protein
MITMWWMSSMPVDLARDAAADPHEAAAMDTARANAPLGTADRRPAGIEMCA